MAKTAGCNSGKAKTYLGRLRRVRRAYSGTETDSDGRLLSLRGLCGKAGITTEALPMSIEVGSVKDWDEDVLAEKERVKQFLARHNQVGGDHYKRHEIQVWDVIDDYKLDFYEGNAIKYILRKKGDRVEDLKKAIHYLQKEIELEMGQ